MAKPSLIDQFFQLDLPDYLYPVSNRIVHWIGNVLVKSWDRKLLGLTQLPIQSILDIGANEGQFSQRIHSIFPNAHIYAFEPLPQPFQRLEKWANHINSSQSPQVTLFPIALGDSETSIEINQHLHFSASSPILNTTKGCETTYPFVQKQQRLVIQQKTLDGAIAPYYESLEKPILIKLF
jgi:FkbM family methyltransferase